MTGMNLRKQTMATLGLVLITILAAIQYVFLQNVPDTVSTFAFVCVTNVIGFVILGALQFRKLAAISRRTLLKGILFAAELIGFNSFLLLGSRHLDAVVISSVVSFYFVFITPILQGAERGSLYGIPMDLSTLIIIMAAPEIRLSMNQPTRAKRAEKSICVKVSALASSFSPKTDTLTT